MFCKQQVAQLRDYVPRIHEAGAELVVVGNGSPEHARWFIEDTGVDVPLYTDPTLKVYEAADARSGLLTSLNPGAIIAAVRTMLAGFRQSKTMGHGFQQGGVLVITSDGDVPYHYVSRHAGDHPDPEEIITALQRLDPAPP